MAETGTGNRTQKFKPFAGRPAGRAKCGWEDDVGNGVMEMKCVKWAEQYRAVCSGRVLL
jgi:hypothetical protein